MRSYHPLQKLKNILDISYEFLEKLWEYVNCRATNSNQKALIGQNSSCYFNIQKLNLNLKIFSTLDNGPLIGGRGGGDVISNLACACIWPIAPRLTFFNAIEGFHSLHALTWKCQIRIYSSNIFNRIFFDHPGAIGLLLFLLDHSTYIFDITYESVDILSCHRPYAVRKSELKVYYLRPRKNVAFTNITKLHEKQQSSQRTTVKFNLALIIHR